MPTLLQGAAAPAPNGGMLGAYSWVQCIKGWPHMCEGQLQSKLDRIVFVQPPQGCEPMGWGAPTAASAPVGAWVTKHAINVLLFCVVCNFMFMGAKKHHSQPLATCHCHIRLPKYSCHHCHRCIARPRRRCSIYFLSAATTAGLLLLPSLLYRLHCHCCVLIRRYWCCANPLPLQH